MTISPIGVDRIFILVERLTLNCLEIDVRRYAITFLRQRVVQGRSILESEGTSVSSDNFGIFFDEGPHHWGFDLGIITKSPIHAQYRIPKDHIKIKQRLGLSRWM
jgi:hypothetical protein